MMVPYANSRIVCPIRRFVTSISLAIAVIMVASPVCKERYETGFNPAWKLDEHGNPDFKPHDFEDAVVSLRQRFFEIAELSESEKTDDARKFRQILRWLPEFAADTPIRKTSWDRLAAQAKSLEAESRAPGFFDAGKAAAFGAELDNMNALIPPDPTYRRLLSDRKSAESENWSDDQ